MARTEDQPKADRNSEEAPLRPVEPGRLPGGKGSTSEAWRVSGQQSGAEGGGGGTKRVPVEGTASAKARWEGELGILIERQRVVSEAEFMWKRRGG